MRIFTAVFVGVLACLSSSVARGQEGAPASGVTQSQFRAGAIDWETRRLMEVFKARHQTATPEDLGRVETCVRAALDVEDWQDDSSTLQQVRDMESDLQAKGLADSMVHALASNAAGHLHETILDADAAKQLDQFVPAMAKDGYPADIVASLGFTRARCGMVRPQGAENASKILVGASENLAAAVREGAWTPVEQRYLFRRMKWSLGEDSMLRQTGEALKGLLEEPGCKNPWLAEVVLGEWEITEAWMDRGSGWASTVTREGWEGFARHLAKARAHLLKAYAMHPEFPEAAGRMVTVAMAGGLPDTESARLWFDRAVKAQFDYRPAYDAYMCTCQQRWGGSNQAVLAFGVECAATRRYDTSIPVVLFNCVRSAASDSKNSPAVWRSCYEPVREMLEGYIDHGGAMLARRAQTRLVLLGLLADRPNEARAALERLGGPQQLSPDLLRDFRMTAAELTERVYTATSAAAPRLKGAAEALGARRWDQAASEARAALELARSEAPPVLLAIKQRAYPVLMAADFARGKTISPRYEPMLPGWLTYFGDFAAQGDGALTVKDGGCLLTGARFGTRYEVSAEVKSAPSPSGLTPSDAAGFRIDPHAQGRPCDVVVVKEGTSRSVVITGINGRTLRVRDGGESNRLTVQIWDDLCIIRVNDQMVFNGRMKFDANHMAEGDMIGFVALGPATFTNVSIRRLTESPGNTDHARPAPRVRNASSGAGNPDGALGPSPFRRF